MWEVELIGGEADLSMLADAFFKGETVITRADDKYFLRSDDFEELGSAPAVRDRASEIVKSISGLARLTLQSRDSLRIGAVHEARTDGTRAITLFPDPVGFELRVFPATITLGKPDGSQEVHRPADRAREWLKIAESDESVRRALRLRDAGDLDWVGLYRLYEVIHEDADDHIVELQWVSRKKLRAFTHTANSVDAVGDQARHGRRAPRPPKNPMDLNEARRLVDQLLEQWIRWKIEGPGRED